MAVTAAVFFMLRRCRPYRLLPLRLPGVMLHELAHWLAAFLTLSSPSPIRVLWKKNLDGGITYAHVRFVPGMLTAGLVAMAPLLVLPWVAIWLMQSGLVAAVLAGSALAHGFPSRADWVVLLSKPASWPFTGLALAVSYTEWWNLWIAP